MERAEAVTGVAAEDVGTVAHAYGRADRAQLCWTLGITEHHIGVDNAVSLINLALLTGHVGRDGSGLSPLRGQNNVQGGGDMGAIPDRLPGFQDIADDEVRNKFNMAWGTTIQPRYGKHLTAMFEAMEHGELRAVYCLGENPAQSEADISRTRRLLEGLDHLVVQDIFLTRTAEMAHVVLPATAAWSETEGTVTNSERRVQRVRKALDGPYGARDDVDILLGSAARLGYSWTYGGPDALPAARAEAIWDELRSLSPMHQAMSYARLEALGGIQWPCYDKVRLEPPYLHGRLWASDPAERGKPAPFSIVHHDPPVEAVTDEYPLRLTTGRRLDSYDTGVQSGGLASPAPGRDHRRFAGRRSRDRRGRRRHSAGFVATRDRECTGPNRHRAMRPGLVFMTFHSADEVDGNVLTIEANDPRWAPPSSKPPQCGSTNWCRPDGPETVRWRHFAGRAGRHRRPRDRPWDRT